MDELTDLAKPDAPARHRAEQMSVCRAHLEQSCWWPGDRDEPLFAVNNLCSPGEQQRPARRKRPPENHAGFATPVFLHLRHDEGPSSWERLF
jgi:hypothetical protein